MKKIIFSTMIASLLAFVGCQNEELVSENTNNGGEKVILTANIQGAADSRVALTPYTENGATIVKVAWNESGEKFKVYGLTESGGPNGNSPTWFNQIEGTKQFEGTLPESATGKYEAVYGDPSSLVEQDGKLGQSTATDSPVLMSATFDSSSPSITFQHVTAILKPTFKVNGTDIDNSITKIVMGNVAKSNETNSGNGYYLDEITITPTSPATVLDDNIYIHLLVFPQVYIAGHEFTFTVTAGGMLYTGSLTIPTGKSIVAGNLYNATIALTEVNACCLPAGIDFNGAITAIPNSADVTAIEFVANLSDAEMDNARFFSANNMLPNAYNMPPNAKYKIIDADGTNPNTLKICTDAEVFMFNADCSHMFQYRGNYLNKITSIEFNNCVNTENVTNMYQMFGNSNALEELDLSYFVTSNVIDMSSMFTRCHNLISLDIRNFNVNKVTNFSSMFYRVGNKLASGKTQIYVANPNPFADKENTSINSVETKAEYVVVP